MLADGFGSQGQAPTGDVQAIPAEAVLEIDIQLVSWKVVEEITEDKKVIKKIMTPGEGYEKPNDGSTVKGITKISGSMILFYLHSVLLLLFLQLQKTDLLNVWAVKYVAKLADGTIFEKKGDDEELFQFVTDEGMLRKETVF